MGEEKVFQVLVSGGEATAGPPLGPSLGPLGINVIAVVEQINSLTKDYAGMKVPVKVIVDAETKDFRIEVGVPTTAALIVKEAGIEKGSSRPHEDFVGNLSFDKVIKIARSKMLQSYANDLKSVVKEVLGACVSIGVKVNGEDPRRVLKEVKEGRWDKEIEAAGP